VDNGYSCHIHVSCALTNIHNEGIINLILNFGRLWFDHRTKINSKRFKEILKTKVKYIFGPYKIGTF